MGLFILDYIMNELNVILKFNKNEQLSAFSQETIDDLLSIWDTLEDRVICRKYNNYIYYQVISVNLTNKGIIIEDNYYYSSSHIFNTKQLVNYELVVVNKAEYEKYNREIWKR